MVDRCKSWWRTLWDVAISMSKMSDMSAYQFLAPRISPSMGKKTNLKATLSNFQEKQRRAQLLKAKHASKKDILKKPKPSAKSKGKRPTQSNANSSTIPLTASDTILLIGEGNFSFARALFSSGHETLLHLSPSNITATTYDSEEACYEKYPDAREIVQDLREKDVKVLFSVDARRLEACKELKKRKWQRIVWNFPHAGASVFSCLSRPGMEAHMSHFEPGKGISDQDRNVLSNQLLILDFLKSAASLLQDGAAPSMISRRTGQKRRTAASSDEDDTPSLHLGENGTLESPETNERGTVLITLRNTLPYTLWYVNYTSPNFFFADMIWN